MSNLDEKIKKALEEIAVARTAMLLSYPFYGTISMYLDPVAVVPDEKGRTWLNTLATDGKKLYYNPDFVLSLTPQQLVYGIAHEILHCVFNHVGRCPDKAKARLWNVAIDYIVNDTLVRNKIGKMIESGLYDPRYNEEEWTAEEVYQDLLKREENGESFSSSKYDSWDVHLTDKSDEEDKDSDDNGNCSSCGKDSKNCKCPKKISGNKVPSLSEKDLEIIRNELNAIVIQAAENLKDSKGAGQIPASIKRLIDKLTDPKLDWKDILIPYLKSMMKEDYNPKRLSKKAWYMETYIPTFSYSDYPTAVVFIDASGSISEHQLAEFLSEVRGCMEQFTVFKLLVGTFDTKVYNVREFTPENLYEIEDYEIKGGGGTDFECVFDYLKKNDIVPERLVVFTDGYPFGSWGDPDYCDTLWIINNGGDRVKPPFGQYVYYDQVK